MFQSFYHLSRTIKTIYKLSRQCLLTVFKLECPMKYFVWVTLSGETKMKYLGVNRCEKLLYQPDKSTQPLNVICEANTRANMSRGNASTCCHLSFVQHFWWNDNAKSYSKTSKTRKTKGWPFVLTKSLSFNIQQSSATPVLSQRLVRDS